MRALLRTVLAGSAGAMLLAGTMLVPPAATAANGTITVWADPLHAPVVSQLLAAGFRGYQINVVSKELTAIRDELATAPAASAPDVVWGDQASIGTMVAAGSVVPLTLPKATTSQFPANVLSGFQYGYYYYGLPVQTSSVALITNVDLVPTQPVTFKDLSKVALALKAAGKVRVPLAVAQGGDSDGYQMYPLFSGLGGYFFGKNAAGSLDPYNLGLANKTFSANAALIDGWNSSGLIKASLDAAAARKAFVRQKSPFWIAGPEEMATIVKLAFRYRITAVPTIVTGIKTGPLIRTQGFMVTKFAAEHGVADPAARLVSRFMATPAAQLALATAEGRSPANKTAAGQVTERRLVAFTAAGVNGVAVPNIPQMASVWGPYGGAWVTSTQGADATPAKEAFIAADATVKATLG